MTKKNFNKLMHFSDIETAYKNDQYPDAECMLTYPGEVTGNRPFIPAGVNLKPLTITRNGSYNPADFDADGFSWVDADVHPTAKLVETITTNGDHDYTGDYKDATITVDVHPTDKLVETITTNGDHDYTGDYKDATITVDVHPSETLEETLDERKTYNFIGEFKDAEITVDVPYTDIHIASGPIASFEGEDLPLKELKASIVPVQAGSGDPSPTNVRPISGWSGVTVNVTANLFDKAKSREVLLPFMQGQTIYVMQDSANTFNLYVGYTDGTSDSFIMEPNTKHQFTFAKDSYGVGITESALNVLIAQNKNMMVSLNDFTGIVPFGTTTTIPFTDGQGQSVEVFGGSVDVVNGGKQPRTMKKEVLDENDNWTLFSYDSSTGIAQLQTDNIYGKSFYKKSSDNLCNIAKWIEQETGNLPVNRWTLRSYNKRFVIAVEGFSTVEEWKTYLQSNPITFIAELATPTTFYTQPTSIKSLDGENNVFASTGDVYVEYQTVWTQPTPTAITLDYAQISSISNKYMGAISTNIPVVPGYYAISHYNSDQIAGGTNLALVNVESLPTTITLGGLSNFRLNVTANSVEVNNYDGSAKDVYMSIMKIPDNAICVKPN